MQDREIMTIVTLVWTGVRDYRLTLEGEELVALRHAIQTLQRCHPLLIIEEYERWMRRYNRHPGDVERFLRPLGYAMVESTNFDKVFL